MELLAVFAIIVAALAAVGVELYVGGRRRHL
jgi:hypothetical protein